MWTFLSFPFPYFSFLSFPFLSFPFPYIWGQQQSNTPLRISSAIIPQSLLFSSPSLITKKIFLKRIQFLKAPFLLLPNPICEISFGFKLPHLGSQFCKLHKSHKCPLLHTQFVRDAAIVMQVLHCGKKKTVKTIGASTVILEIFSYFFLSYSLCFSELFY